MSISLKPLSCNGLCKSCYENMIRKYQLRVLKEDYEKMYSTWKRLVKEAKEKGLSCPVIHGGEPLLIPFEWLKIFLEIVYKHFGRTSVQTNGISISEQHIKLFKKYKTHVGISIDGHKAELNYGRWNRKALPLEEIQKLTDKTLNNIQRLREAEINVSIITLLRKYNAIGTNLQLLKEFLLLLWKKYGVVNVRLNPVITYDLQQAQEEELSSEELGKAWIYLCEEVFANPELNWLPCRDFVKVLTGDKNITCTFQKCDIWATQAEIPVLPDGSLGNCLHGGAAAEGVLALRAGTSSEERYLILPQIPQDLGGCKDCRWWQFCYGGCPAAGLNGDWRNKTRFCKAYKMMFEYVEHKIKGLFPQWKPGQEIKSLSGKIQVHHHGDYHGDSHGDRPHGDHTDGGNV